MLPLGRDPVGDRETARIGKQDVEEHDVGAELGDSGQGRRSIRGLAHNRVAGALEQSSGQAPKARMIIDDQHADAHPVIVAQ